MKIIEEYNDGTIANSDAEGLAIVGRATHLLRSPKDANTAFIESERVAKRVETLAWHAALFIDKYDPGHTEEVLREALAIAPHDPALLAAMARVKLDETLDFDGADKLVKDALAVNPKLAAAFAVRAGIALRDMDLAAADAAVAAGLAVNPNDLELPGRPPRGISASSSTIAPATRAPKQATSSRGTASTPRCTRSWASSRSGSTATTTSWP